MEFLNHNLIMANFNLNMMKGRHLVFLYCNYLSMESIVLDKQVPAVTCHTETCLKSHLKRNGLSLCVDHNCLIYGMFPQGPGYTSLLYSVTAECRCLGPPGFWVKTNEKWTSIIYYLQKERERISCSLIGVTSHPASVFFICNPS